jgi:hypothetical protein
MNAYGWVFMIGALTTVLTTVIWAYHKLLTAPRRDDDD